MPRHDRKAYEKPSLVRRGMLPCVVAFAFSGDQ